MHSPDLPRMHLTCVSLYLDEANGLEERQGVVGALGNNTVQHAYMHTARGAAPMLLASSLSLRWSAYLADCCALGV